MEKNRHVGLGRGTISIILILVTLVLILLSMLTLITASSNFKLVQKAMDQTTSIYEGYNTLEHILKDLNEKPLEDVLQSLPYAYNHTDHYLEVYVPITPYQCIKSTFDLTNYDLISWQLQTDISWDYEDFLSFNDIGTPDKEGEE